MIISKYAYYKISPPIAKHLRNLGYDIGKVGGRAGKNTGKRIKVKIEHLRSGAGNTVSCKCDQCGKKYLQRFCRNTDVCYPCRHYNKMKGNQIGKKNKGKKLLSITGENHPRWNPNKSEMTKYARRVHWLSKLVYREHKDIINPLDHPRGVCGQEGAYQLDHIKSIKQCFLEELSPEEASKVTNLQMLPWKDNREKWS